MAARRVLFAIRDPFNARQPGLAKAIQVAKALGATLELFHALPDTLAIVRSLPEYETADLLRERIESQLRAALERMCAVAARHRVSVSSSVAWDSPPHEAIVRRAGKSGAELIVAECHQGVRTRPWLIHLTDWELLRTSPVPVLLLKNGKPYHRPLLLAAVDPTHAHAKPLALDDGILATAGELGKALRGKVHMVHANYPTVVGLDTTAAARQAARSWSMPSYEQLLEQERESFERFRASAAVPRTRAHLVEGNPVAVIPRAARDLKANIVVMGALSRSGLARMAIGNTAERVLSDLPCDVLVIKPAKRPS